MNTQKGASMITMILAVAVIGLLAASAVLYTRKNTRIESLLTEISALRERSVAEAVLYTDTKQGFQFVTPGSCRDYFEIRSATPFEAGTLAAYELYLPRADRWSGSWIYYSVMTRGVYNAISDEELPGKPQIILTLENDIFVTTYNPQDGPTGDDAPPVTCAVRIKAL